MGALGADTAAAEDRVEKGSDSGSSPGSLSAVEEGREPYREQAGTAHGSEEAEGHAKQGRVDATDGEPSTDVGIAEGEEAAVGRATGEDSAGISDKRRQEVRAGGVSGTTRGSIAASCVPSTLDLGPDIVIYVHIW